MMEADEEQIVFRYEAQPDKHGVIDGRELAAKLMEDAFSLLVPYAKGCGACAISLFTGIGDRVIFELLNERRVKELICSYNGETEEEKIKFFEAHRDATEDVTDEILKVGMAVREAAGQHHH